eukprot:2769666-Rhodomonas_salina.1
MNNNTTSIHNGTASINISTASINGSRPDLRPRPWSPPPASSATLPLAPRAGPARRAVLSS